MGIQRDFPRRVQGALLPAGVWGYPPDMKKGMAGRVCLRNSLSLRDHSDVSRKAKQSGALLLAWYEIALSAPPPRNDDCLTAY